MKEFRYSPTEDFEIGRKSGGLNIHIPLVGSGDSKWFGKLCCPNTSGPPADVCGREVAFSRLAKLAGAPAIEVEFVSRISNMPELLAELDDFRRKPGSVASLPWADNGNWAHYMNTLVNTPNKILVGSPFIPATTTLRNWPEPNSQESPEGIVNLVELLQGCLAHVWLGAGEGNVDLNIIVDKNNHALTVDYGFAGPNPYNLGCNLNGCRELKYFLPKILQDVLNNHPDKQAIIEEAITNVEGIPSEAIYQALSTVGFNAKNVLGLTTELERRRGVFRNDIRVLLHS